MNLLSIKSVINDNKTNIKDPICNKMDFDNNNNNDNLNKEENEKDKETLFTPFSLSSNQSRLTQTNTAFLYETDDDISYKYHGSMSLLDIDEDAIYQYSDNTEYDDYDNYDNDDNDHYEECDPDSIPLIDRITPPPPLFINDIDNNGDDEYEQYKRYHDDSDSDDDNQEIPNKNKLYLSIKIPSLKMNESISNLSPKPSLSIFDINHICNTITPISSNNDDDSDDGDDADLYYDHIPKLPKMEKKFNWNTKNRNCNFNISNNYYLQQHVQSLIVQNISR